MDCNLFNALREYNLDYFIPESIEEYEGEDSEEFYYNPNISIEEYEERYEEYERKISTEVIIKDIDDLMFLFDYDYMERNEFLSLNPWDLFHITYNQFKMIDFSYLDAYSCLSFSDILSSSISEFPSIEQRIKWAIVASITGCNKLKYSYGYRGYGYKDKSYIETNRIIYNQVKHFATKLPIHKAIDVIQLYSDYIRFLPDALIMNRRREEQNRETNTNECPVFNYTLTPKPSHLKDLHDKAFRDYNIYENEIAQRNKEALNKEIKNAASNPFYKKFLFRDKNFIIKAPESNEDFIKEGNILNHCIASYSRAFATGETFIYFLRRAEAPDTPFFSIEVIPPPGYKGAFRLKQCYTFNDSISKDKETKEFILLWCKTFNIKVSCPI